MIDRQALAEVVHFGGCGFPPLQGLEGSEAAGEAELEPLLRRKGEVRLAFCVDTGVFFLPLPAFVVLAATAGVGLFERDEAFRHVAENGAEVLHLKVRLGSAGKGEVDNAGLLT